MKAKTKVLRLYPKAHADSMQSGVAISAGEIVHGDDVLAFGDTEDEAWKTAFVRAQAYVELTGLRSPIIQRFCGLNLTSREKIMSAVQSGMLDPRNPSHIRNFGWVSYAQVRSWLGLPHVQKTSSRPVTCPKCKHSFMA